MSVVSGSRGGFLVTRGKPRYALLEGRHFAVGRGKAHECATVAEAYAKRDEMLSAEQSAHTARRAEMAAPVPCHFKVGDRVRFDECVGVVCEINERSVLIKTSDGNLWRRAPSACEVAP